MKISFKHLLSGGIIGAVLLITAFFSLPDGKLHLVFCDVGQGDAIYMRTPDGSDILFDGGPNDKVLTCLGKHMPFYDRNLELVLMTHPQKDHFQGLISVVERYSVDYFVIGVEGNETAGYKELVKNLKEKNVNLKNLYRGDQFFLDKVNFTVLWPDRSWVAEHTSSLDMTVAKMSGQGAVLGLATTANLNDFSYYVLAEYGSFKALFTGDGDSQIQPEIMKTNYLQKIDVLKFPHHGSKTGVLPEFLEAIGSKLVVISVGKNSYGHPTKEALEMLAGLGIKMLRTDLDGEVEIVSDGRTWEIR
mgnify:CR=1 FL=1